MMGHRTKMQTIFTTADVPPRDAFDYWMDVVRTKFIKCSIATADRLCFQGDIKAGTVGELHMFASTAVTASAPIITRSDGGSDDLLLFCPRSRWQLESFDQQRREINPRTLLLVDDSKTFIGRSLEPVDLIGLRIPRCVLEERISTTGLTNQPIAAVQGDAALLMSFMREIVCIGPSTLSLSGAMMVREQVLDLIAVVLGNLSGVVPKLGAAMRFATMKLRAAIESQLTNPNADRQSIAAAAGISERHANRLLGQEGTSIRRRRRCFVDRR